MVATIVLNQNNLVADGNNNTFVYKFPNSVAFPHHEIAIQSVSMFYSWTNINVGLANNTFSYLWGATSYSVSTNANIVASTLITFSAAPTNGGFAIGQAMTGGSAPATITAVNSSTSIVVSVAQTILAAQPLTFSTAAQTFVITIPTGQYSIADLNALLQFNSVKNGHYLVNGSNQNVYYLEMFVNATRYAIQVNTFPVPIALPAGWSAPQPSFAAGTSGWAGFPAATFNPCMFIPAKFNELVGFPAGTYTIGNGTSGTTIFTALDTGGVNKSYISSIAPQVQPNSSVYFSISNIENKYSIPNSIIYSLNPAVEFGLQINEYPPQFAWNKLLNGTYNQIRLQILGLNFQPLQIQDPNMTIVLVIRDTKDLALGDFVNQAQGGK